MRIIPAIDIVDRRVVRLQQGKFDKEKIYAENPIMTAKNWKEKGAELLHVVDLDGAKIGKPVNLDVIKDIASVVDTELGGGLRNDFDIESAFKAGIKFVVIGTSAVSDESFRSNLVKKFGEKIIFAVDVKNGKVAIKGWREVSDKDTLEYIKELESIGAKRIIYTDISKDGMMEGPNFEVLKYILENTNINVTASGGVSKIEDIKKLKEIEKYGLDSVIIGKALYEGTIDLKEALSVS